MLRVWTSLTLTTTAAVLLGGCGIDPAAVPIPGTTVDGPTYSINIEFSNALNLPTQAKVVANGARVGALRNVTVVDPTPGHPGRVVADVRLMKSVRLPIGTTAQLRQDTILGDVYIGLASPVGDDGPTIPPHGTITLDHTKPAAQIEDLMASMSTFVTGGSMQRITDIVNSANTVMPADSKETARIFGVVGNDIRDLADNVDSVDRMLAAIQSDLHVALDNSAALDDLLTERGTTTLTANVRSLIGTLGLLGNFGIIGHAVAWLGPFLTASNSAAKAFVPLLLADEPFDTSAPSNLNRLEKLLREKIIPFAASGPKINVRGVRTEVDPRSKVSKNVQVDSIIGTLRMIGAVR